MKKMKAIENIRVGEKLYKSGEEFEIDEIEAQRLINLKAAEFVSDEIDEITNEEQSNEEEIDIGNLKNSEKENKISKKGKKNE